MKGIKLMKIIKTMLLLTAVYVFTTIASAEQIKKCKKWSLINPCPILGGGNVETETDSEGKSKKGKGFFRKIIEFGGENIGEPG